MLQGPPSDPTYSLYFGHDYIGSGEKSVALSGIHKVRTMDDVEDIPRSFGVDDYAALFQKTFYRTGVKVVALVNLIYIVRKVLGDYETDRKTEGRRHVTLY